MYSTNETGQTDYLRSQRDPEYTFEYWLHQKATLCSLVNYLNTVCLCFLEREVGMIMGLSSWCGCGSEMTLWLVHSKARRTC